MSNRMTPAVQFGVLMAMIGTILGPTTIGDALADKDPCTECGNETVDWPEPGTCLVCGTTANFTRINPPIRK